MSDQAPLDPTHIDRTPFEGVGAAAASGPNGFHAGATPGYTSGSHSLDVPDIHLLDYVRVIYKRRWTAVTAFLAVFVSVPPRCYSNQFARLRPLDSDQV